MQVRGWEAFAYTHWMPRFAFKPKSRSMAKEQDILKQPPPKERPVLTSRRIGIHTSGAGGVENAAERAYRLGCNTLQIFFFQSAAVGAVRDSGVAVRRNEPLTGEI